jgi:hypothetical protein
VAGRQRSRTINGIIKRLTSRAPLAGSGIAEAEFSWIAGVGVPGTTPRYK